MNTFRPGQKVGLEIAGETCEIVELLGSGGRGQVYRVALNGEPWALKWYYSHFATREQRARVRRLVDRGAPNNRFLWPVDLATSEGVSGFGYLMPVRASRHRCIADVMTREVDPTFRTLTQLALELADSFLRLHSAGLCYSAISFGNLFFDPFTGELSICDNDCVLSDGEKYEGHFGSPRFLAPEIVRGEAGPSMDADLHSLAVILFYLFLVHHPLEGRREREIACFDLPAMRILFGVEALFIFDPKHGANRPLAGVHNNATLFWNFYPGYVRDIFTLAFTEGLRAGGERVRESEWRTVFTRMRDQIHYCQKCGAENFLPDEGDLPVPLPEQECWACREMTLPPMRLMLDGRAIVLNQDTLLYAHHLDSQRRDDYSEVRAQTVPHPSKPDLWGLRNISPQPWISVPPSGKTQVEVPTGRSISLVPGLRIQFGTTEGLVL